MQTAIQKAIEGGYGDWLADRYFSPTELAKFKGFTDRYSNPRGFEFYFEGVKNTYPNHWAMTTNTAGGLIFTPSEITNHAEFWQALGKAMGWKLICEGCGEKVLRDNLDVCMCEDEDWEKEKVKRTEEWLLNWHRFIDKLASGGTADEFFKDLLTSPE